MKMLCTRWSKVVSAAFGALFAALCFTWWGIASGSGAGEVQLTHVSRAAVTNVQAEVRELVANAVMGNFEPSLEMRESVDFLLTPAFLVQEALSEDVVLTYPAN